MKFNHLLPRWEQRHRCPQGGEHYYLPTSHVEATLDHVAVRFRCKKCGRLSTAFLDEPTYQVNKNIINKYAGDKNDDFGA